MIASPMHRTVVANHRIVSLKCRSLSARCSANSTAVGTGGIPFMAYLQKTPRRDEAVHRGMTG
jgi:hypothetical protein